MTFPESLNWLRSQPGGAGWLSKISLLLSDVLTQWDLVVTAPPYPGGAVSYVVPVSRAGDRLVLKLQWPHAESEHEADALRAWNGNGAVRLIEHDKIRSALLLEECRPGRYLADSGLPDPIAVMVGLLKRLSIEVDTGFRSLADEVAEWQRLLPKHWEDAGRPCERELVDAALDYMKVLPQSQGQQVLVHQDLHGHNVLSAEREPWLAIDPKPLRGEREFSLAPIVRSLEFGHTAEATLSRLDRMAEELELDRDRSLGWTVAQTMAWSFGGTYDQLHHQTVRWLLAAR